MGAAIRTIETPKTTWRGHAAAAHRRPVDAEQRLEAAEREEQNLVRRGEDGRGHQNHRDAEDDLATRNAGGYEKRRGERSERGRQRGTCKHAAGDTKCAMPE